MSEKGVSTELILPVTVWGPWGLLLPGNRYMLRIMEAQNSSSHSNTSHAPSPAAHAFRSAVQTAVLAGPDLCLFSFDL